MKQTPLRLWNCSLVSDLSLDLKVEFIDEIRSKLAQMFPDVKEVHYMTLKCYPMYVLQVLQTVLLYSSFSYMAF